MGGILGLGASFSLLKVRDILGPQFGVSAGGMLSLGRHVTCSAQSRG